MPSISQQAKNYPEYSRERIDKFIAWAEGRNTLYYGATDEWLYAAFDRYSIKGKTVLLIGGYGSLFIIVHVHRHQTTQEICLSAGSNVPFYESMCLAAGAQKCVTLEYNKLRYDHPRLHTLQPQEFDQHYPPHTFDVVMSISSFEHDGLGRYI